MPMRLIHQMAINATRLRATYYINLCSGFVVIRVFAFKTDKY